MYIWFWACWSHTMSYRLRRGELVDMATRYRELWTDQEFSIKQKAQLDVIDTIITSLEEDVPNLQMEESLLCAVFPLRNAYFGSRSFIDIVTRSDGEPEYRVNVIVRPGERKDAFNDHWLARTPLRGWLTSRVAKEEERRVDSIFSKICEIAKRYSHPYVDRKHSCVRSTFGGIVSMHSPEIMYTEKRAQAADQIVKYVAHLRRYGSEMFCMDAPPRE